MYAENQETQHSQGFSPSRAAGYSNAGPTQEYALTYAEVAERIEGYQDEWFQELKVWEDRFYLAKVMFGAIPAFAAASIGVLYGMTQSAVCAFVLYSAVLILYRRTKKWMAGKEFECYSNIKENIYVYSRKPFDQVENRKLELEKKIYESANKSYPIVVAIHFTDHENANEQWDVEWPTRLLEDVLEDRSKRHKKLGEDDPDWYKRYILKQDF